MNVKEMRDSFGAQYLKQVLTKTKCHVKQHNVCLAVELSLDLFTNLNLLEFINKIFIKNIQRENTVLTCCKLKSTGKVATMDQQDNNTVTTYPQKFSHQHLSCLFIFLNVTMVFQQQTKILLYKKWKQSHLKDIGLFYSTHASCMIQSNQIH